MRTAHSFCTRLAIGAAAVLAAAACAGGSGPGPPPALPAGQPFTLSGTVTYEFVPAVYDVVTRTGGLAFGSASARPVRHATVQVRQGAGVLATTTTAANGGYSITFTPGPTGQLMLVALAKTTTPPIQVEDNTNHDAIWGIGSVIADASPTKSLHATHGWTGAGYDPSRRIAAPFAILDSMYTAARKFLDIPRTIAFPPLKVNWSPENVSQWGDKPRGRIGTSHYAPSEGEIYILGKAGIDTDEFDAHVIVHEWGHYFEDKLSRADSPGGPHGGGDILDPRLAFGEGYGNALASMLLPQPIYADTYWSGGALTAFGFDVENIPYPTDDGNPDGYSMNPGAFSEISVMRLLYDLFDPANEPHDTVALGLGPIYDALVDARHRDTDAFTTIGSFIASLKAQTGVSATAIDSLLASYGIGPISDAWGTNDPGLGAMYAEVAALPYAANVTLDGGFDANKWQSVQYFVVAGNGGQLRVTAASTSDVGLAAYSRGALVGYADQYAGGASPVTETMTFASQAGSKYVIVLTGYEDAVKSYSTTVQVSSL
jgi:hypothetical protein